MAITHKMNFFLNRAGSFLLLFAIFFFCADSALAASPESLAIGRPVLLEQEGRLWLNLPVSVTNESALVDMLRDGASMELIINCKIERKRSFWFNENITENSFSSIIRHDPLSREFRLTLPPTGEVKQDRLLVSLLAQSWKDMTLPLANLNLFEDAENYIINIDISLKHTELPPWLEKTLIFWPKDIVDSERISLDYKVNDATVSR